MVDQVDHDLEALELHRLGHAGATGMGQVIDAGEVDDGVVARIVQGREERRVLLPGGMQHELTPGAGEQSAEELLGSDLGRRGGLGGLRSVRSGMIGHGQLRPRMTGVEPPTPACSMTMPAPSPGRRVSSPSRICWCRVRMACMRVSGEGGQPGA